MDSRVKEGSLETIAFMELAVQQATLAMDSLEVPVGCVIVEDGEVIASGRNRTTETRNATRHAEMEAIDVLLEKWQQNGLSEAEVANKFSKCTLYVTCEPCIMCAAALSILGIMEVYYGCANDKFGGCGSILSLHLSTSEPLIRFNSMRLSLEMILCPLHSHISVLSYYCSMKFKLMVLPISFFFYCLLLLLFFWCSGGVPRQKGFKCTRGIMASEAVSLLRSFYEQGNPNAPKPHRPPVQRE